MKRQISVKSHGGLIEEIAGDGKPNPFEIMASMEEVFQKKGPAPLDKVYSFEHNKISREDCLKLYVEMMLQAHFGKWIPNCAQKHIDEAFKDIDEMDDIDPIEGKMSSVISVIDRIRGELDWELDRKAVKLACQHPEKLVNRTKANGQIFQRPPLLHKFMQVDKDGDPVVNEDGKRIYKYLKTREVDAFMDNAKTQGQHWKQMSNTSMCYPAFYRLRLPKHKVDLSKDENGFDSCFRYNENFAAQTIATRLGIKGFRGGAAKLVERLMGKEFTASMVAYRKDKCWFVDIGAERKRQETLSRFWLVGESLTKDNPNLDANGDEVLSPDDPDYIPQLTISQLESKMSLLAQAKDLGVEDESGKVVDYMNEEEEFMTLPPARVEDEVNIDFTRFAEDDPELACLFYLQSKMETKQGLTLGDVHSKEAENLIYGTLENEVTEKEDGSIRKELRWRGGLYGAMESLRRVKYAYRQAVAESDIHAQEELSDVINNLLGLVTYYETLEEGRKLMMSQSNNQPLIQYWYPAKGNSMHKMSSNRFLAEEKEQQSCWFIYPENEIVIPEVKVEMKNPQKVFETRYETHNIPERTTVRMEQTLTGYRPVKVTTPAKVEHTHPNNASPRLRALLKGLAGTVR